MFTFSLMILLNVEEVIYSNKGLRDCAGSEGYLGIASQSLNIKSLDYTELRILASMPV